MTRLNQIFTCLPGLLFSALLPAAEPDPLTLDWEKNFLTIRGGALPEEGIRTHYLEAYCRAGSTDADWVKHTVIPHQTELVEAADDGSWLKLRCRLEDGLVVDHHLEVIDGGVAIHIVANNPTGKRSEAHWAQPCMRVGTFTGAGQAETDDAYAYIRKSFVFLDGKLERLPTRDWALKARYMPGQVWAGPGVPRSDVNPRPLHPEVPSCGLIGCFSADDQWILAMTFEPYQELFQGVIRCLHSDFRLGGIEAGESLEIEGMIHLVPNDVPALLKRHEAWLESVAAKSGGPVEN